MIEMKFILRSFPSLRSFGNKVILAQTCLNPVANPINTLESQ